MPALIHALIDCLSDCDAARAPQCLRAQLACRLFIVSTLTRMVIPRFHDSTIPGTIFPMPINYGSSWNDTALELAARVQAAEARTVGADRGFSPVINMFPDPRYGYNCLR